MKKSLILLWICGITSALSAQIPNAGFEQVLSTGTPAHWPTCPILLSVGDSIQYDGITGFYQMSADAHSGQNALELRNAFNYSSGKTISSCAVGVGDSSGFGGYVNTFPMSGQPVALQFWYKIPQNPGNDTVVCRVSLNNNLGNAFATGEWKFSGIQAAYSQVNIPLIPVAGWDSSLMGSQIAASASILFRNQVEDATPTFGTRWLIDDLQWAQPAMVNDHAYANLNLFPNPGCDILFIPGASDPQAEVIVFNLQGQSVLKHNGSEQVNVSTLPAGLYLVRLQLPHQIQFKQWCKW